MNGRLGAVREVRECGGAVEVRLERGSARFEATSDTVIRMQVSQYRALQPYRSYSVDGTPATVGLAVQRRNGELRLATQGAALGIDERTFAVSLYDRSGRLLSRGLPLEAREAELVDRRTAAEGEDYYGLGERVTPMGRRGYIVENWNWDEFRHHNETTSRMYASFPFFVACDWRRGAVWGYFLDSSYRSVFDLGSSRWDEIAIRVARGDLVVYFIAEGTVPRVVEAYTGLTGRAPVPPLWALGYHQCRYSYMSAHEAEEVADAFRARRIPCDAIWYDIDHMHEYRVFTFDPKRFPDPAAHFRALKAKGFRVVVIVDPGVKVDPPGVYPVHDEGTQLGYFLKTMDGRDFEGPVWPGGTKFPDFSRPEVRQWWGGLHRIYTDAGVDGFWNDMNEPALLDARKTLPEEVRMCDEGWWSTMDRMHNVYGLLEAQATVEGLRSLKPGQRVFLITRAGFPGIQRYAGLWTGDNTSSWAHLEASIPQLLNLGLSGVALVGADVGGYSENGQPELFARWIQAGAFYPFCRNHSMKGTARQEPWSFGPEIEAVAREAIALRYRYLPTLYQLAHEASRSGAPIARPLFWYTPTERAAQAIDQFMVGAGLLAAPVVRRGARQRLVWLPPGVWYEHAGGSGEAAGAAFAAILEGDRTVIAEAPLRRLPLYVRSGTVLAASDPIQSTAELDLRTLLLEVWPGEPAEGVLYEDDGGSDPVEPLVHRYRLEASGRLDLELASGSRFRRIVIRTVNPASGRMSEQERMVAGR